jgi:hypothetical protein
MGKFKLDKHVTLADLPSLLEMLDKCFPGLMDKSLMTLDQFLDALFANMRREIKEKVASKDVGI